MNVIEGISHKPRICVLHRGSGAAHGSNTWDHYILSINRTANEWLEVTL